MEHLKPAKLDYSLLSLYDHVQSPAEKNEILAKGGTPDDFEMLDDDEDSDEDDDDSSEERVIDFDLKATFCQDFLPSKSGPQYDSNSIATHATGATGATEAAKIAEEQNNENEEAEDAMAEEQHEENYEEEKEEVNTTKPSDSNAKKNKEVYQRKLMVRIMMSI